MAARAIDGRLEWREWETNGNKRRAVDIVQFLGGGNGGGAAETETSDPRARGRIPPAAR